MTNEEKLNSLLNAINEVETFNDGSVIIRWKSNVAHEINGVNIINASGSQIISGHQVHMNPVLPVALKTIKFQDIQKQLDIAVYNTKRPKTTEDCGCN